MEKLVKTLTKLYRDDLVNFKKQLLESGKEVECSTSMEDCLFVYLLVKHFKPTSLLEIGTFVGSTLKSMIIACEENGKEYSIHTIDNQDKLELDDSLLKNVYVHKGWSSKILKFCPVKFDFIFSDACLDEPTAKLLKSNITENTVFATHDWVPPFDKGLTSVFHMVNNTQLENNLFLAPSHKCNWIYEKKSYQNMHEKFSLSYVKWNSEFEFLRAHNKLGVNNCVAVILPKNLPKGLEETDFIVAKNLLGDKLDKNKLNFNNNNYYLDKENNELYIKSDGVIVHCKFLENLPYVHKIYNNN